MSKDFLVYNITRIFVDARLVIFLKCLLTLNAAVDLGLLIQVDIIEEGVKFTFFDMIR